MTEGIEASVTLYVDIYDPPTLWDHAHRIYALSHLHHKVFDEANPTALADALLEEFVSMCGSRAEPELGECLRMIFDPGESPPGVQIEDSSAEVRAHGI